LTYWSIFISSLQFPAFKPYIHKQINYQGGF
jgi:hypothetical protein